MTASEAERRARVALSRLAEPGDELLGAAVAERGAAAVLRQIRDETFDHPRLADYRARLPQLDVDRDLDVARRGAARLVVPGDPEWPDPLGDLGPAAPLVLWVRGGDLRALTHRAVAVVGSRACTDYGAHVAGELGISLTDRRWTVVSGGAFGIDAAAHRGALVVGGATLAVLACGIDQAYPAAHHDLFGRIVGAAGAVVTELPPGAHPTRLRFLQRNRLIAALTRGTVVVEAALRSGARSTANHAQRLSRVVMAVPGPVTSAPSSGCHEMIRAEGAALVTCAEDVLDLVGDLLLDAAPERRGPERPEDHLDPVALRVLEALPLRRFADPDRLAMLAGLDGRAVLRALAALGSSGLAEQRDGQWRRAPTLAAG